MLETIGFANAIPSCIEALTRAGAIHGADGRSGSRAGWCSATIKRGGAAISPCTARTRRHDMLIQGTRVHYGTAGAAVHLVDVEKREYRESLLQDIYDAARLVEGLDNIHFFQRPMVPRDIPDPLEMDFNTLYACVMGTSKHVGTRFTVRENVAPALEMLYAIAGGEENFRARPFVSNSNCFVVPPMKFAEDACGVLEACVEPAASRSCCLSAGQAGATAPAAIAGAVVQAVAEVLVGLDLRQRAEARPSGDLRHLAVRLRPAHRRDVGRLGRAGGADLGLRADGAVLRSARRLGRRHDEFQAARHPVRLRKGHHQRDGRAVRASTWSMNRPACTPRCSASAWKA